MFFKWSTLWKKAIKFEKLKIHLWNVYEIYSPHSVLSSLATVPATQAVQEVAPLLLIVFTSHWVQEIMSEFLYVPSGHLSETVSQLLSMQKGLQGFLVYTCTKFLCGSKIWFIIDSWKMEKFEPIHAELNKAPLVQSTICSVLMSTLRPKGPKFHPKPILERCTYYFTAYTGNSALYISIVICQNMYFWNKISYISMQVIMGHGCNLLYGCETLAKHLIKGAGGSQYDLSWKSILWCFLKGEN